MKRQAYTSTFVLTALLSVTLMLAGCSSEEELRGITGVAGIGGGAGSVGGGTTDGGTAGGGTDGSATPDGCSDVLCVQINLRVPDSNLVTNLANCETSAVGDTCTASIPEQDLFFKDLEFVVETDDGATCEYLSFHYYRYLRSDSASYAPRTDPSGLVDCATEPVLSKECWGGAWTE